MEAQLQLLLQLIDQRGAFLTDRAARLREAGHVEAAERDEYVARTLEGLVTRFVVTCSLRKLDVPELPDPP